MEWPRPMFSDIDDIGTHSTTLSTKTTEIVWQDLLSGQLQQVCVGGGGWGLPLHPRFPTSNRQVANLLVTKQYSMNPP